MYNLANIIKYQGNKKSNNNIPGNHMDFVQLQRDI